MALCETCTNPVLNDGQTCGDCAVIGRQRELPRGFVAFGWHSYSGAGLSALAKLTVAHLIPDSQVRLVRGGTVAVADGPAVCGARPTSRKAERDHPGTVFREAQAGDRAWCARCFFAVAEGEMHAPTWRVMRTGVSNRYGRGASGSGGRNTHVECACGWTSTANVKKREAEARWRQHVREAVEEGLFRIEEEGFAPKIGTLTDALLALKAYTDENIRDALTTQLVGESMGAPVGSRLQPRYVTITRTRVPMIPRSTR